MPKLYRASVLVTALLMSSCQSPIGAPQRSSNDQCDHERVQHLLGRTATPDLLEQARSQAGAQSARLLRPDQVVTLEFDGGRLNIHTDKNLKIERLTCG